MGNIGIDVSKEELAKQCTEWRKLCNEQRKELTVFETLVSELRSLLDLPTDASNKDILTAMKEMKDEYLELHTEHELYGNDLDILRLTRDD